MDAAPALTQIHCMREQCLCLGTCGGAIGAEREVAVDLQFRIRFEGSQPEFGRYRTDARQDHDVGMHFEIFRDLIVAGEEDGLALAREAANLVEQVVHHDALGNEGIADAATEPAAGAEFLVYVGMILFVEEDRIVGTDEGAPFACAASKAGAESWEDRDGKARVCWWSRGFFDCFAESITRAVDRLFNRSFVVLLGFARCFGLAGIRRLSSLFCSACFAICRRSRSALGHERRTGCKCFKSSRRDRYAPVFAHGSLSFGSLGS